MDEWSKLIFMFFAGCSILAALLGALLYGACNYYFTSNEVDATCQMWQYEFRLCGDDLDCFNKIKGDRPKDCPHPSPSKGPAMYLNPLLMTDSYKLSHFGQYPAGTEYVYSYLESRGGAFPELLFFGARYYLRRYLCQVFGSPNDIDQAERVAEQHMGSKAHFNREGWEHIFRKHGGRLPVRIKAVAEGTVVPTGNVMMTIENTDPKVPWLTNWLETLLMKLWYPITVASQSRSMAKVILAALEQSGTPESLPFRLHDFGYRGVSSEETAAIGAAAHLITFKGTDTLAAIPFIESFYGGGLTECPGFSIPATEHSTITSWGGPEHEVEAYENLLRLYPTGLVACVSDSYDIFRACSDLWGGVLKDKVLARDGCLVVRPDSGDPATVVMEVLRRLGDAFGVTVNAKGYKVLDPHVRVIQGDGISRETVPLILGRMLEQAWSADNITFGSGGALLQKLDRDTCKFAIKCSAAKVNGEWRDVQKQPVTDPSKRSKAGHLALVRQDGTLKTVRRQPDAQIVGDQLSTIFENGVFTGPSNLFGDIRARAAL